jgi:hypothetical protein
MHVRPHRGFIGAVAFALVLAACDSSAPSSALPNARAGAPIACVAVDVMACEALAAAAVDALEPDDPVPVWIQIGPVFCAEPCLRAGFGGARVTSIFIELDGGTAAAFDIATADGRVTGVHRMDHQLFARDPGSNAIQDPAIDVTLGHCGLASGIDVDRSFWNPVGVVPEHGDAINAAEARFSFTSRDTAMLATDGGLVVNLVRHPGRTKHFAGCD